MVLDIIMKVVCIAWLVVYIVNLKKSRAELEYLERAVRYNNGDFNVVNIKKLDDKAVIPTRGSGQAAGYDLYACTDEYIKIQPHKTVKIGTGVAVELHNGTFGAIYARSGLATKKGLRPANSVGVIDSDYRGEIIVSLHNDSNYPAVVQPGDRIAQLVVHKYYPFEFKEIEELSDTERGNGGFGSTGN